MISADFPYHLYLDLQGPVTDTICFPTLGDANSFTAVGTWICRSEIRLGPQIIASSLVILVFKAQGPRVQNFASRLETYFNRRSSELLFDAVKEQPLFIYIALYQCFNSFTTLFYQFQEAYDQMVSTLAFKNQT